MDFDDIPPAAEDETYVLTDAPELPPPVPTVIPEPFPEEDVVVPASLEAPLPEPSFIPEPEPVPVEDALTKFNREWQARIEEKRAAEFEFEKQARAKAQEELASWKEQKHIRLTAKKDKNRTEQQVLVETLTSESENLKVWDRVGKLIDATENENRKGSDTGRMRKLFIQLKNEPLEVTRAAANAQ